MSSEAALDPKVSSLLSQHSKSVAADDVDEDEDALFASLEAEDDTPFRAARAQQLAAELAKQRRAPAATMTMKASLYRTLHSDDEVLRFTTETEKVVLHFFHQDFARCATMDGHLQRLAEARAFSGDDEDVRFARVDVKDAEFVVEKLGVRILPCVVGFIGGVGVGRVVGFEGLGVWAGANEAGANVTRALEERLVELKVCGRKVASLGFAGRDESDHDEEEEEEQRRKQRTRRRGIQGSKRTANEDDDEEWD